MDCVQDNDVKEYSRYKMWSGVYIMKHTED